MTVVELLQDIHHEPWDFNPSPSLIHTYKKVVGGLQKNTQLNSHLFSLGFLFLSTPSISLFYYPGLLTLLKRLSY